jgi:gluconolactonase
MARVTEWNWEEIVYFGGSVTEGPAWDGRYLWFVYTRLDRVLRFDPEKEKVEVTHENSNGAGGLIFDRENRLYSAEGGTRPPLIDRTGIRQIARYEPDGSRTTIVDNLNGRRLNGPNDVCVDTKGRVWFSDPIKPIQEEPHRLGPSTRPQQLTHSSILRADPQPDGTYVCHRATYDMTGPNGLCFSRDEKFLYATQLDYNGNERRELRKYPVNADGSLGPHTVLHDFGPYRGIDGMRLAADGNIVATAGWGASGPGGMIYVFDPAGRILETHPTPCWRPTNLSFAGPDLTEIYVTSIDGYLLRVRNTGLKGHLINIK